MAKKEDYVRMITAALKESDKFSDGLALVINSTADTLKTLDLCSQEIDGLESATVVQTTRYGSKLAPHPVFKIQRDAQEMLLKYCKILGMTYAELSKVVEEDSFEKFMREFKEEFDD